MTKRDHISSPLGISRGLGRLRGSAWLRCLLGAVVVLLAWSPSLQAIELSPQTVPGATTVDAAAAKALFDRGVLFVDSRKGTDWEAGRVPCAVHIELKKVFNEEALRRHADNDTPLVFYCNAERCLRASKASALAVGWGFQEVYYFRDGYPAWKQAGYPIE